jgi:glutaredoxin-like protein
MALISEKDRQQLLKVFENLPHEVTIIFFTQEVECQFCKVTHELIDEIHTLSPKFKLEVYDYVKDADTAKLYGITKIPAIALIGERDTGIRFYGIPAGYEFTTFVEDLVDIARRDTSLAAPLKVELAKVTKPVHLQVMVSPTCPYCPTAVRTAHRFALLNPNVRADMVEISEFPFLAVKYGVQGVPVTIINEKYSVVGAIPEAMLIEEIKKAVSQGDNITPGIV